MIKQLICAFVVLTIIAAVFWFKDRHPSLDLKPEEAHQIGMLIWMNECSGKKEGLTSWNDGEEFASLGIGHFLWHPAGLKSPFKEGFPDLIQFAKKERASVPKWIVKAQGCPWKSREEFLASQHDPKMIELRDWLFNHIDLQVDYIVRRLPKALPMMLKDLPKDQKRQITYQFYRVARAPMGLYVLIDYLNFKGEGSSVSESYQGYGWGLLQVLERMHGTAGGKEPIEEFVVSAKAVLDQRIRHAPPERKEERWRHGWFNRLGTYLF